MDRRELILAQLATLLQAVDGVKTVARNRGELPEDKRPAVTILDADETAGTQITDARGGPGLKQQPVMVIMRPEIFILLEQREPHNVNAGQDLNAFRIKVLNAINSDTQLASLVTANGSITYEGTLTDFATGRAMTGQMQMQFAFSYPFKASEFAEP